MSLSSCWRPRRRAAHPAAPDGTFHAALRLAEADTDLPPYRVWAGFSGDEAHRHAADAAAFAFQP